MLAPLPPQTDDDVIDTFLAAPAVPPAPAAPVAPPSAITDDLALEDFLANPPVTEI